MNNATTLTASVIEVTIQPRSADGELDDARSYSAFKYELRAGDRLVYTSGTYATRESAESAAPKAH